MELFSDELGKFVLDVAILNTMIKTGETISKEQEEKCNILKSLIRAYYKLLDNVDITGNDVFNSSSEPKNSDNNSTSVDDHTNIDDFPQFSFNDINDYYTSPVAKPGITLGSSTVYEPPTNTVHKVEESTTTDEERDELIFNITQFNRNQASIFIKDRWVNYVEVIDNYCDIEEKETKNKKDDNVSSSFDTDSAVSEDSFKDEPALIDYKQFSEMNNASDTSMDDNVDEIHNNLADNSIKMIPVTGPTLDENNKNIKLVYEIAQNSLGFRLPDNRKLLLSDNSDCSESTVDDSYDASGDEFDSVVEFVDNDDYKDTELTALPYIRV